MLYIHALNGLAMKTITSLVIAIMFIACSFAQKTSIPLYKLPDKKNTCIIKENATVNIGRLLLKTDSLTETQWMSGKLTGAGDDFLKIQIDKLSNKKTYASGQFETNTTSFGTNDDKSKSPNLEDNIPFSEVDIIEYSNPAREAVAGVGETILMASLVALFLCPLASINYETGNFNAETYKTCALSVSGALLVGFSLEMFSGRIKRQIHPEWPGKDAKLWSLEKNR